VTKHASRVRHTGQGPLLLGSQREQPRAGASASTCIVAKLSGKGLPVRPPVSDTRVVTKTCSPREVRTTTNAGLNPRPTTHLLIAKPGALVGGDDTLELDDLRASPMPFGSLLLAPSCVFRG
jgi:hypothetical protein